MDKNSLIMGLVIGIICMIACFGCSGNLKYERFSNNDPDLNLEMEYLSGWFSRQQKGLDYAQVIFSEPKRQDKIFKANIVVTVKETPAITAEALANDLIQKRLKFKEAKLLSKSKKKILDSAAENLLLSYKTLEQLNKIDAQLIPVKERIVIFKKGTRCYIIRYQNTAEEFDKFNSAFYHSLKTLRVY